MCFNSFNQKRHRSIILTNLHEEDRHEENHKGSVRLRPIERQPQILMTELMGRPGCHGHISGIIWTCTTHENPLKGSAAEHILYEIILRLLYQFFVYPVISQTFIENHCKLMEGIKPVQTVHNAILKDIDQTHVFIRTTM